MNQQDLSFLRRMVKEEIDRSLNVLLVGRSKDAGQLTESIEQFVPGAGTLEARPLYQPFGFASRAPDGIPSLVGRIGAHAGARSVIGHRDPDKPEVDPGEAAMYSVGGMFVRVYSDRVKIGSGDTEETLVCGEKLTTLLQALIDLIAQHTHAAPGAPPSEAAAFTLLKTGQVDGDKLLAIDSGGL